jgi:lambda family phage portal protein
MNPVDRVISWFSPAAAYRRQQARLFLAAYEAAKPDRLRKFSRDHNSGDLLARTQARPIRAQARELDRNHDLAHGALNTMVNNIVGPVGIAIEPQPRSVSGELLDDLAHELLTLYRDWCKTPEVTYSHNYVAVQRLTCRTWLRDGESFALFVEGDIPSLDHRTRVPLSLEMLEPDMIPSESELFLKDGQGGIIRNGWGQPVAYRVYKNHPGDKYAWQRPSDLKTVPAARMLHIRRTDRIGQSRGVSDFASIITRLEDLKDYEESERIAAKIAASMAAYIKKGTADLYEPATDDTGTAIPRSMRFQPGMVFDDLMPGEEIGMIDTNRPNTGLEAHRDGQLRAVAAGLGASYSSLSRNYNGTYSAQRQELVEQWVHYQVLAEAFTSQFVQPVWERFVALAVLAGLVDIPADLDLETLDDALFIGQQMPWIDPKKEADAFETLETNTHMSGPEIIRRRGGNPLDVIAQQKKWKRALKAAGLEKPAPVAGSQSMPAAPNQADDSEDTQDTAPNRKPRK